jgi:hypothetical protein
MQSYEVLPSKIVADGQKVNNMSVADGQEVDNMSLWQTDRKWTICLCGRRTGSNQYVSSINFYDFVHVHFILSVIFLVFSWHFKSIKPILIG